MKLDYASSPLVVIGGWNPNIFSLKWIDSNFRDTQFLKDVDPANPEDSKISFHVDPGQVYALMYAPVEVDFIGLKMRMSGGRLEFILSDNDNFELLEKCALKICDLLPTTSAISYGINFTFTEDQINQNVLGIIRSNKMVDIASFFDTMVGIEDYNINIPLDNRDINIFTKVNHRDSRTEISFNFSFNISFLSEFQIGITNHPIHNLYSIARNIISEKYSICLT